MPEYTCYVITSDLSDLPIVLVEATNDDDLFSQLELYREDQPVGESKLSEESKALVTRMRLAATAPNDGLLGTAVSEQFTLPELGGMRIHLQLVG